MRFATPRDEVCAVIRNADGQYLVIMQKNRGNRYSNVGGGIEPGEDPLEAMAREIKEEIGIICILSAQKHHVGVLVHDIGSKVELFAIEVDIGTRITCGPEINHHKWFTLEQIVDSSHLFRQHHLQRIALAKKNWPVAHDQNRQGIIAIEHKNPLDQLYSLPSIHPPAP